MTRETFDSVNGFSNNFYGWGGEDDDFFLRLTNKGIQPIRLSPTLSSYRMLPHKVSFVQKNILRMVNLHVCS